jgi:ADP-dependent NAD(P)H-hydrate dehydratase / NAD(P)H-hydrate epimerase
MPRRADQILSVAQMRAAEDALVALGITVDALMQTAGRGAADYVWRLAAGRPVTVLCGPGNNGGDGYVIAEAIRERGGEVRAVAASAPATAAAQQARALYSGPVADPADDLNGAVLVDCLFGSGLSRPLSDEHAALLNGLAARHRQAIAIDVPSGVDADTGALLNPELPHFDLTVALGAWKFAHFLMPAAQAMGALRLVGIGVAPVDGAAAVVSRPAIAAPAADAHKYTRGLVGIVAGPMGGAAVLAARGAQGSGAGYVRILAERTLIVPPDIVVDRTPLAAALTDTRIAAVAIGSGFGRQAGSRSRLDLAVEANRPLVLDADALSLVTRRLLANHGAPVVATPHEGELRMLEAALGLDGAGGKLARARLVAARAGMIVVAKGPDTVIVAPDGRVACAHRASSWLSTAGTGDVLAGLIAGRLAVGGDPFVAACEAVWLHGEAARLCGAVFTASELADALPDALAACL